MMVLSRSVTGTVPVLERQPKPLDRVKGETSELQYENENEHVQTEGVKRFVDVNKLNEKNERQYQQQYDQTE